MPRLCFLLLVHHQGVDVTKVFSVRAAGPMVIAIFLISDRVCVLERISTGRCSRTPRVGVRYDEQKRRLTPS